jgi:hypothetical protein
MPLCDRLETLNFTQSATAQGVVSARGLQAAFNSFMVAIGVLDYDSLLGNSGNGDLSDSVSHHPHDVDFRLILLTVFVVLAILLRIRVLPSSGSQ